MNSSPVPLLRLHHHHAVRRGGLTPSCAIAIRLVDRPDLVIRTGDCVVLRQAPRAGLRRLQCDLRIRRASIPPSAVAAVIAGWHSAAESTTRSADTTTAPPVVHLLRVGHMPRERDADWRQWGQCLRRAGGAVVILGRRPHVVSH